MGNFLSSVSQVMAPQPTNMKAAAVTSAVTGNPGALKNAAKAAATGKAMNLVSGKASLPPIPSFLKKPSAPVAPVRSAPPAAKPTSVPAKPATAPVKPATAPLASAAKSAVTNKAKTAALGKVGSFLKGGSRRRRNQRKAQTRKYE